MCSLHVSFKSLPMMLCGVSQLISSFHQNDPSLHERSGMLALQALASVLSYPWFFFFNVSTPARLSLFSLSSPIWSIISPFLSSASFWLLFHYGIKLKSQPMDWAWIFVKWLGECQHFYSIELPQWQFTHPVLWSTL